MFEEALPSVDPAIGAGLIVMPFKYDFGFFLFVPLEQLLHPGGVRVLVKAESF